MSASVYSRLIPFLAVPGVVIDIRFAAGVAGKEITKLKFAVEGGDLGLTAFRGAELQPDGFVREIFKRPAVVVISLYGAKLDFVFRPVKFEKTVGVLRTVFIGVKCRMRAVRLREHGPHDGVFVAEGGRFGETKAV